MGLRNSTPKAWRAGRSRSRAFQRGSTGFNVKLLLTTWLAPRSPPRSPPRSLRSSRPGIGWWHFRRRASLRRCLSRGGDSSAAGGVNHRFRIVEARRPLTPPVRYIQNSQGRIEPVAAPPARPSLDDSREPRSLGRLRHPSPVLTSIP
jgi:hypothetical protein